MPDPSLIRSAQVVVPCRDLAATFAFLSELGFRAELVRPADAPALAVLSGHGCTLRLERAEHDVDMTLHLVCPGTDVPLDRVGPGLRVRFEAAGGARTEAPFVPEFVPTRYVDSTFHPGRAGMAYRDLIPGRLGGRYIASHIRIPGGGPVADWVHRHEVRFQMIFCRGGWVRVVYEDQGAPFLLEAGDCVLQPPGIGHRVLEASPGVEVIEIGSPAEHATHADHALALPTEALRPERAFGGQRFVRHVSSAARWQDGPEPGFEFRDTGIAAATSGLADVRVLRAAQGGALPVAPERCELRWIYVLEGAAALDEHVLGRDDCCAIPPEAHATLEAAPGLELLEVRVYPAPRSDTA